MSENRDFLAGGIMAFGLCLVLFPVIALATAPHYTDGWPAYLVVCLLALLVWIDGYASHRRALEEQDTRGTATEPGPSKKQAVRVLGTANLVVAGAAILWLENLPGVPWRAMDSTTGNSGIQVLALLGLGLTLVQLLAVLKYGWSSLHVRIGFLGTVLALMFYSVLCVYSVPLLRTWVGW